MGGKTTTAHFWGFWLVIQACESPVSAGDILYVMCETKITARQFGMTLYNKPIYSRGSIM